VKKKIIALVVTLLAMFCINVAAYGDFAGGAVPIGPLSARVTPLPTVCLENCQGECEDD